MGHCEERRTPKGTWGVRDICLWAGIVLLSACTGSSGKNYTESAGLVLTGSVGDGPIVGAHIQGEDAQGSVVFTAVSDASANYLVDVPDGTYLPLIVRVSGGLDLVTGRSADFTLLAVAFDSGPIVLNASPYSTLAVRTAQCMGELNPANVAEAWDLVHDTLNLGWDRNLIADPMRDAIAEQNIGTVLLANEALGEVVRRTSAALSATDTPLNNDDVLGQLACDLADGQLDGVGTGVSPRTTVTAMATALAVRLEVISGELQVDGEPAVARLDDALQTVLAGSSQQIAAVAPTQALIDQTRLALGVLQSVNSTELLDLAIALQGATPNTARGQLTPVMDASVANTLSALPEQLALSDDLLIDELLVRQSSPNISPLISFSSDQSAVPSGGSATLSWASSGVELCSAAGGWTGAQTLSGSFQTPALTNGTEFTLSCSGIGGAITERLFIAVLADPAPVPDPLPGPDPVPDPVPNPDPTPAPDPDPIPVPAPDPDPTPAPDPDPIPEPEPDPIPEPEPVPVPTIVFTADQNSVDAGDSVSLGWSSSDASSCSASGAWSGSRSVTGTLLVGPLNADVSFILTCSGPGGSSSANQTISVIQPLPLPVVDLTASELNLISGSATTLIWTAADATSCTASGNWSGSRNSSGSESTGSLSSTATYMISCTGAGGTATDSVTVQVNPAPADPPVVTLNLAQTSIDAGDATTLSWSASDATDCSASGAWSGTQSVSGSLNVAPTSNATYDLVCNGAGGSDSASVTLTVISAPPTLTFSSSQSVVNAGSSVTLSWTASNADSCDASGGWSGSRELSANELVGPINSATTFTLTCSGPGGNVMEMLTVGSIAPVALTWVAPSENVDGSPLTDLAGYRIYYGTTSRAYSDMVEVMDPLIVDHTLNLSSGDYYVAMTALDQEGNESAYSNEVLKSSP